MTYSELKAAIGDWLARSDVSPATADLCIDMTEAQINRTLRVRAMEAVYFRALDSDGSAPVPTTFKGWKDVVLYRGTGTDDTLPLLENVVTMPLQSISANNAAELFAWSSSSKRGVARIGSKFYVAGKPAGPDAYSLGGIVYNAFPALSDSVTTNWLTDNAPDLLLAGCMAWAANYVKNIEEVARWTAIFDKTLADMQTEHDMESFEGAPIVREPGVWNA